jgi:hypothetical protein
MYWVTSCAKADPTLAETAIAVTKITDNLILTKKHLHVSQDLGFSVQFATDKV